MNEENMGEQFKGIAGANLLNNAFDGVKSIAAHFSEPEHKDIFEGVINSAAHMKMAIDKHNGEVYDGDDPVSKLTVKDHLHQSLLGLITHLPNEITERHTGKYVNDNGEVIDPNYSKNYDPKRSAPNPLSKEGKEIQGKYNDFVSNIRAYNDLMGNK
jgi:hypothetical protein